MNATLPDGQQAHDSPKPASYPQGRLKIAVLNRAFDPTGGGAERYSVALVEALAPRHEIHVFAQRVAHQFPGITYHHVSAPLTRPRWVNQLWFATTTWWATRRGFDIVHSHENTWHGNVQTVHVLPVRYNLFNGRDGAARLLRWVKVITSPRLLAYLGLEKLRYAVQAGRQIVVTSESLRPMMSASYPSADALVSVVTPGITMPASVSSSGQKRDARALLGLRPQGPLLLFVGNDYRKKGLSTLLKALAGLPADVMLAVVGNPAHIPAFRAQAQALQLESRVFFLGSLQDVRPAYDAADCLVHPTLEDTFAMVVLEAMAHALPVIVSGARWCGISELLTHGVNALILDDPGDADALAKVITQLLNAKPGAPASGQKLGQGALAFAHGYQWNEIALRQELIYFKAVAAKAAAPH